MYFSSTIQTPVEITIIVNGTYSMTLQDCEMQLFSDFKHKYLVKFQSLVCNKNNFIQVSPVKANNMSGLALLNKRTSFCKT